MILNGFSLTNFIDLSTDKKSMVLDWRNSSEIRKWMYNTEIISYEMHENFITSLQNDKTKMYYLVSNGEEDLGVIYFNCIDYSNKTAELGIYSNLALKGNGNNLMNCICKYAFSVLQLNKLIAEVFEHNEKAINLYKRFGFIQKNTAVSNDKKIIYMELENEHR